MNIYFKNTVQTGVILVLFIDYYLYFWTNIYLNIFHFSVSFSIFVILSFYNYFFKYFYISQNWFIYQFESF